jgi:hypothetical protein
VFERRFEPLLPFEKFAARIARALGVAFALIGTSLGIGMVGYHVFARLSWLDSVLNAAMILTGMGPVDQLVTPAAKIFAGCYALFSGVVFLSVVAVLAAPVAHRILHRFHLGLDSDVPGP